MVRHVSFTLSIPRISARAILFYTTLASARFGYCSKQLWDICLMSHIAPVVSHSNTYVRRCRSIHIFYSLHRSPITVNSLTASTLPSYINNQLCATLTPDTYLLVPHLTFAQSAAPFLSTTIFWSCIMLLPNSIIDSSIHELAAVHNRLSYLASSVPPADPVCVVEESSSLNFHKLTGVNYLYFSLQHHQSSCHIYHAVNQLVRYRKFDPSLLAIRHIHYDEHEYILKPHPRFHGRVCLRVKLPTRRNDTIY